jgi:hypothetical protein
MSINFAFFARLIFKGRSLVCKQCKVRHFAGFLFAFFQPGATRSVVFYMFFCLDAKEPKNQGCDALLTNILFEIFVFVIAAQFAKMECFTQKCKKRLRSNSLHSFAGAFIVFCAHEGFSVLTLHSIHFFNAHASRLVLTATF